MNALGKVSQCAVAPHAHICIIDVADLTFSVCVPDSCGPADVTNISSPIFSYVVSQSSLVLVAELNFQSGKVTCGNHAQALGVPGGLIMALVGLATLAVCVPLSARSLGCRRPATASRPATTPTPTLAEESWQVDSRVALLGNTPPGLGSGSINTAPGPEAPPQAERGGPAAAPVTPATPPSCPAYCSVLWRLRANSTHRRHLHIPGLDALRALAGLHVGLSITLLYMRATGFDSIYTLRPPDGFVGGVLFNFIAGGDWSVDTLLAINGFLIMTLARRAAEKAGNTWQAAGAALRVIGWFILRWWLLLLAAVLFMAFLLPSASEGPLWFHALRQAQNCASNPWPQLALLGNFLPLEAPWSAQCLPLAFLPAVAAQCALVLGMVLIVALRFSRRAAVPLSLTAWAVLAAGALAATRLNEVDSSILTSNVPQSTLDVFPEPYMAHFVDMPYTRGVAWMAGAVAAAFWHEWGGTPQGTTDPASSTPAPGFISHLLVVGIRAFVPGRVKRSRRGSTHWRSLLVMLAAVAGQAAILACAALQYNPSWSSITLTSTDRVWFTALSHTVWSVALVPILLLTVHGGLGPLTHLLHSPLWSLTAHLVGASLLLLHLVAPAMTLSSYEFFSYSPLHVAQVFLPASALSLVLALLLHEGFVVPMRNAAIALLGPPSPLVSAQRPGVEFGLDSTGSSSDEGGSAPAQRPPSGPHDAGSSPLAIRPMSGGRGPASPPRPPTLSSLGSFVSPPGIAMVPPSQDRQGGWGSATARASSPVMRQGSLVRSSLLRLRGELSGVPAARLGSSLASVEPEQMPPRHGSNLAMPGGGISRTTSPLPGTISNFAGGPGVDSSRRGRGGLRRAV